MSKIALLIVGELRFENNDSLDLFLNCIKGHDNYIATYKKYKNIAEYLSGDTKDNIIFLDDEPNYINIKYETNMYQWWNLQNLIRKYKDKLIKYDIIYKLRTDIEFPKEIFQQTSDTVNTNTIYCCTDFLFFGRRNHFIRLFENYFDDILNIHYKHPYKYININYKTFIKTMHPSYAWRMLIYPDFIYDDNFAILKDNIRTNMDKLIDINRGKSTCKFICVAHPSVQYAIFSSERTFALNCINNGFIEGIGYNVYLYKNRHNFGIVEI